MGANHFSLVVYGSSIDEVRDAVSRWLRAKGFDPRDGEPLTALDPDKERGVQLRWNDKCVVVLYDHLEEQERLLFELKRLGHPVLDYWLHDSDVWGYTLWHEGAAAAGFVSDPHYGGGYEEATGPDDVAALCRLAGFDGQERHLRDIRKGRPLFAEEVGRKFVRALGAEAAAAQYGDGEQPPQGFDGEDRWYRRSGWDPMDGFDLGSLRFRTMEAGLDPQVTPEQVAAYEASMRRWQWFGAFIRLMLWPVLAPIRLWVWWRMRAVREQLKEGLEAARAGRETPFEVDGDRLVNRRLRCAITLAPGARVDDMHRRSVFPGSAFGFGAGSVNVFVRAVLPGVLRSLEVLGPHGAKFSEETLEIGGRPARRVVVELAQGHVRRFVVVHGPEVVLLFETWSQGPIDEASRDAFDRTVESLRFFESP